MIRSDLQLGMVAREKRTECPLQSGEIHFRTGEGGIFGSVNRGDWRSFEPLIAAYVDAAFSPTAETVVAAQLTRLSA